MDRPDAVAAFDGRDEFGCFCRVLDRELDLKVCRAEGGLDLVVGFLRHDVARLERVRDGRFGALLETDARHLIDGRDMIGHDRQAYASLGLGHDTVERKRALQRDVAGAVFGRHAEEIMLPRCERGLLAFERRRVAHLDHDAFTVRRRSDNGSIQGLGVVAARIAEHRLAGYRREVAAADRHGRLVGNRPDAGLKGRDVPVFAGPERHYSLGAERVLERCQAALADAVDDRPSNHAEVGLGTDAEANGGNGRRADPERLARVQPDPEGDADTEVRQGLAKRRARYLDPVRAVAFGQLAAGIIALLLFIAAHKLLGGQAVEIG
ncbi:hypothetical protein [Mesorhizobium sp.]|uniref:hypothetical protein n=1 Tax=Mesorhizobium sp. TaxID=1871066 RepID=UPI0025D9B938|nr:hypothetical protein [Mesorhizobium sp.]